MAEVIFMPRMSDTMTEGNIVGWLKKEGDRVEPGDTLAEVETDKATMELDSPAEGVILHIAIKEGPVPINAVIGVIGKEGEDWKAAIAAAKGGSNGQSEAAAPEAAAPATPAAAPAAPAPAAAEKEDSRVKASPLAKSVAKETGIDIAQVAGSGDQGRIVKRDVEAFIEGQKSAPAAAPAAPPAPAAPAAPAAAAPSVAPFYFGAGEANFEDRPVSMMRKTIARRLGESKFSAPHFYLTVEVNMDKTVQLRDRLNEVAPVKISFNDFVIKACTTALRLHPAINSSWLGDKIRTNHDIHIGVAVAVDEGLLVPVIRHADMKTMSQINTEVKALAGKAKDRKLQPEEMQGNTFTISNLGMFDIEEFTAIINPPDSCILAVGSIVQKPIVKNGEIVVGNMMRVTLSCDHRVVDGATGAKFLQTLKGVLEDPIRLLV
ncbi:MAG: pyruvate dehydrogenase complex dihydrolipoamide acetyltransferase [Saprospiraceae bacterium]|nr:pyruvate dehydrogenase complex dihydrolipoamide acetyltransferase [Saprospiraceae bacterium]